ncbi:hypothetical protein PUN28_020509 [Cardiocondyla obscurior]|uniref:Uncharacterized protein n=1 Tax=Cardiocondyla obscurior TaxID=286306 RepID=A0AAW2E551_9HYME
MTWRRRREIREEFSFLGPRGGVAPVRTHIRKTLHLPQSICNGVIYCNKKDGGLGFTKLQELIPRMSLDAGLKFSESKDPVIRALFGSSKTAERLRKLANGVRINYPYTKDDTKKYKEKCRQIELKRWRDLLAQGRAVDSFTNDGIGNSFLRDPKLLKPCRFTTALQLRTNTAGNKTSLNRAIPQRDLTYILGQCLHTKSARIRRHNEIRDYIENTVSSKDKTATLTKEPLIALANGDKLQPDLVIQNQKGVFVVDVTVRHEDGAYLAKAKQEKEEKYQPIMPWIKQQFEAASGETIAIVVGTRGAMPKNTIKALATIGIKQANELKTISLIALRSSIEMYHAFVDYDGPLL